MAALNVFCDATTAWPDIPEKYNAGRVVDMMGDDHSTLGIAMMPGGMASGEPSVIFRFDLPDGRTVLAETSLALIDTAIKAFHSYRAGQAERESDGR